MKRNIIFIIVDALRARNMGLYGYGISTTPNIDSLSRDAAVFENAFSCINTTDPSLTTIFSGLYPKNHGILNHGPKVTSEEEKALESKRIKLLPEILKSHGYKTYAIDWLARWHKRGYDDYIDVNREGAESAPMFYLRNIYHRLPKPLQRLARRMANTIETKSISKAYKPSDEARIVTDTAIKILKENKESTFLFIHYWDVHSPYIPQKGFMPPPDLYKDRRSITRIADSLHPSITSNTLRKLSRIMKAERTDQFMAKYDGEIRFVDHHLGRLLRFAQKSLENPMIILTADHGESLVEHGIYFEHHGLYDVNIHVPLVIWSSGLKGRITAMVQHTDLLPTILDILGIRGGRSDGKTLLPLIMGSENKVRDRIFFEEFHTQRKVGIRTMKHKYIKSLSEKCRYCNILHGDKEELYDLVRDPSEERNAAQKNKKLVKRFREEVRAKG
jgi:arylsulfatase A-like enzyme